MDYPSFHLTSLVGSAAPLEVFPTPDFAERLLDAPEHRRTMGGRLHTHRLVGSGTYEVVLPLVNVSSAQRAEITAWWSAGRALLLTFAASSDPQSLEMQIVGDSEPLGGWHPAHRELRNGVVLLADRRGTGKIPGGPFILDDATWGLLDQSYNVLI